MQNFTFEKILSFEIGCDVMLPILIGDSFMVFAVCTITCTTLGVVPRAHDLSSAHSMLTLLDAS